MRIEGVSDMIIGLDAMSGKRLQFVVGKGGVGKSTVTAALALAAASTGERVLAVALDESGGLARLLAAGSDASMRRSEVEPVEVAPGLFVLRVHGDKALAEYLSLIVPIRRLLSTVFSSRFYKFFVAAAPGLKELMAVGKIWYEFNKREAGGNPSWDRIIVDAGASGHSLQYLKMPATVATTFGSGLVHREAERVAALLREDDSTEVHVVATPEEMPLSEACEIVHALCTELEIPVGQLFMNRCLEPGPEGTAEALQLLAGDESRRALLAAGLSSECARVHAGLVDVVSVAVDAERRQATNIARVERELGMKACRLPLIPCDDFGRAQLRCLAGEVAR